MFKNFKLAGAVLFSLFSTNPNISDEDKQKLAIALDTDFDGLKAEHEAQLQAKITQLETDLGAANTEKDQAKADVTAKEQLIAELQPKADKLATMEPEYNTMKAQLEAYKGRVNGVKPNEKPVGTAKTIEDERAENAEAQAEIERLKAEYPGLL